jgi:aminoglycoside phosphotransferase (APT) family kinase protein
LCQDTDVNGAPFYVMEFVEGLVLRDAADSEAGLAEPQRRRAGESIAQTLAALHDVDIDAVGLGDFARRDGYAERQLKRWLSQFDNSPIEGLDTAGIVHEGHDRLASQIPEQTRTTIVHGDYRLDNVVMGEDGKVRAVLDWEICSLGDPMADLGLLMVYWNEPGERAVIAGVTPTAVKGFPNRAEMKQCYLEASGSDISALDFYVAFGYWKLACILQGVFHRYSGGAAAGDRSGVDGMAPMIVELARTALDVMDGKSASHSG